MTFRQKGSSIYGIVTPLFLRVQYAEESLQVICRLTNICAIIKTLLCLFEHPNQPDNSNNGSTNEVSLGEGLICLPTNGRRESSPLHISNKTVRTNSSEALNNAKTAVFGGLAHFRKFYRADPNLSRGAFESFSKTHFNMIPRVCLHNKQSIFYSQSLTDEGHISQSRFRIVLVSIAIT